MSNVKEVAHKALVAQTSEVLVKKLTEGKLVGISKEVALEILERRKEKGSFAGPIPKVKDKVEIVKEQKAVKEPKQPKEPKVKKEKIVKEKIVKEPKVYEQFPDWKPKFKKGEAVRFAPNTQTKKIDGVVISSYPYKPKNSEVREDLKIRVGDKTYSKNSLLVERI